MPDKFGIIGTSDGLGYYKRCFEEIESYWVSRPVYEPTFLMHVVWCTHNNYLYRSLIPSIARIYETGMFDRWEKFHVAYFQKEKLEQIRNIAADSGWRRSESNLLKDYLVSKQTYSEIVTHLAGFIAICLLTFSVDYFRIKLKRTKVIPIFRN